MPDEVRLEELLESGRVSASSSLTPSEVLALHDFAIEVDEARYARCVMLLTKAGKGRYSIMAQNGRGASTGHRLDVRSSPTGFELVSVEYVTDSKLD